MLNKRLSGLIIAISLTACSSTSPLFYKDGRQAHSTTCKGINWTPCLEAASNICKQNGYEVLEKNMGREYGTWSSGDVKEMIFSCKASTEPNNK